ncbi:MAG: SDR family NAD(P)-dependent oxidoreductase [Solirubrobacteraceae bacterium]|nr:SDR family NAD(P)-dependent oxidoreductase [Solirubrobacteraceae bacterium]
MDLTGTTCLVTGANRGIGAAVAAELAQRPLAALLLGARDPDRVELPSGAAKEIRAVRIDLSDRETIDACAAELPPIDVLVNNAGRMTGGLLEDQDMEDVYAMFQVNLVAVAHLTSRVLPGMVERGRGMIVNNTSLSGYAWFPAATTYAASKAGVVALSESLRRELRDTGVGVLHLVTPGVDTDMLDATESVYGRHMDTSGWDKVSPQEWAADVVAAIEADKRILRPGGKTGAAIRAAALPASVLDAVTARMFTRRPRRD